MSNINNNNFNPLNDNYNNYSHYSYSNKKYLIKQNIYNDKDKRSYDDIEESLTKRIIFSTICIIYVLFIVATTWLFIKKAKPYTPLSSKGVIGVLMLAIGTLIVGFSVFLKLSIPEMPCFIFYWIYYIGYLIWIYSFIMRCMKIQYLFKWNISKLKKGGNWKVNLFKSQRNQTSETESEHRKRKHYTTFSDNYIYSSSRFQRSLKLPTNRFDTSFILFLLLVFILFLITLLSVPQFMSSSFQPERRNCYFEGTVDYIFLIVKSIIYIIVCPMFFFFLLEVNESFGIKHNLLTAIILGIPCQLFEYIPQLRLSEDYSNNNINSQIYFCILDVLVMFAVHFIDVVKPVAAEYNISLNFSRFIFNFVPLKHSNDPQAHSDSGFDTYERVMNVPQLFKSFKYFCVTDYAIVDIIFYERWRDIREQVMLYNYYKKRALEGPSSTKNKYYPSVYNIDNSPINSKGISSSSNSITQPRIRNISAIDSIKVYNDYSFSNNNTTSTSQSTSQASSNFSDNFQPFYYFDDNKTPLNKMPDILIPPCLLPLFIGLYQTFINSGSIFELNDIPVNQLERLSNQILQSPLYFHFLNVNNNKNLESNENLSNNVEDFDEDEDNNYNLDRYTRHAQLYSYSSSYENINSIGSQFDHSGELRSYQSSASTKVMSYSHTGYPFMQTASGSNLTNSMATATATLNNTITGTLTNSSTYRNMPGQPKCLFNYEEMNFEEDEAMSAEINLSCTLFDDILNIIYRRIYEYSFSRFISDQKNRKLVNSTLKLIHKQRKKRKNGNRSGPSRNASQITSQTNISSNKSFKQNIPSSTKSIKSYSSHINKSKKNGHHHKYNTASSSTNHHTHHTNNNDINNNDKGNEDNNVNDMDDEESSSSYDYNEGKVFTVDGNKMQENEINSPTIYEVINKENNQPINLINNIQTDNAYNTLPLNNQENFFNTYPLNSPSNKGKLPFDSVNSNYNIQLNTVNNPYLNNGNNNYMNDNHLKLLSNAIKNNNKDNNDNSNINNNMNMNMNTNNNNHYSYHDDLSVFWESEEENEENISIHESFSEEQLITPQLKEERSSDLFKKNMENFRQKLLVNECDHRISNNSNGSSNNNNPYFSNLVSSVKRKSSNISNLLFNRDTKDAIELKSLDSFNFN